MGGFYGGRLLPSIAGLFMMPGDNVVNARRDLRERELQHYPVHSSGITVQAGARGGNRARPGLRRWDLHELLVLRPRDDAGGQGQVGGVFDVGVTCPVIQSQAEYNGLPRDYNHFD